MTARTHGIIMIVVLFATLGIHTSIMIAAGSSAALGIHAIILTVGLLAAYVGYQTGKRVGHRKGVADTEIQQAHMQSCREKGLAPGARLKYGISGSRRAPAHTSIQRDTSMIWDEMRQLEKDWDSYGADPPSEVAIENARAFCEVLGRPHCLSEGTWYYVAPSVEGGVGVTLGKAPGKFYIEFYNDGEILIIRHDRFG